MSRRKAKRERWPPPPPDVLAMLAVGLAGLLVLSVTEMLSAPAGLWSLFLLMGTLSIVSVTVAAALLARLYVQRQAIVRDDYREAANQPATVDGLAERRTLERRLELAGAKPELIRLNVEQPLSSSRWDVARVKERREKQTAQASDGAGRMMDTQRDEGSSPQRFRAKLRPYFLAYLLPPTVAALLTLVAPGVTLVHEINHHWGGSADSYTRVEVKTTSKEKVVVKEGSKFGRTIVNVYPKVGAPIKVYPTVKVVEGAECVRFLVELDDLLDDEPNTPSMLPHRGIPPGPSGERCGLNAPITEASPLAQYLARH